DVDLGMFDPTPGELPTAERIERARRAEAAALASILCLVVVSLLTPAPPEARWRPFFDEPGTAPARTVPPAA
ncbi:MAG TPA: hypothetical protein VIG50_00845, partial [Vicinamibacteria bacterium]